jgi:putative ABC transport system permease protein
VFLRLLFQSFRRQQRRKLLAGIAVTLGVAVTTAMIAIAVDVGDKINRELRSYGANIVVYPADAALDVRIGDQQLKPASAGTYLDESKLPSIKGMFWDIMFSPLLHSSTPRLSLSRSGYALSALTLTRNSILELRISMPAWRSFIPGGR